MAANWIQNKKTELITLKQLEKALLERSDMRSALSRYITSLDLQRQINAGKITEAQALVLFRRAIQQFSYSANKELNRRFPPPFIDQNDLTKPWNMTRALNNPDSLASIQMNDTAISIILTINEEITENEQAQNQQQILTEQTAQEEMQAPHASASISPEKEEALAMAVLGVTAGKDVIEHTFEKYMGKELKNTVEETEEHSNIKSPFEIPIHKPKPPKEIDEK